MLPSSLAPQSATATHAGEPNREGGRALRKRYRTALTDQALIKRAAIDAVRKLDPKVLVKNPVIFVTAVVSVLVTVLFVRDLVTGQPALFSGQIAAWLWFTVLFANFAEAIAEGLLRLGLVPRTFAAGHRCAASLRLPIRAPGENDRLIAAAATLAKEIPA